MNEPPPPRRVKRGRADEAASGGIGLVFQVWH